MRSLSSCCVALSLFGLGWLSQAGASGQDCPHHHHGPLPKPARTVCDAGHPFQVKDHAVRSDARHHFGYYVGGGAVVGGRGICPPDGTFGWDYSSLSRVRLNWTRGRYQMGGGTYKAETSEPVEKIAGSLLHRD
jgi:hypothetical protein